MLHSFWTIIYMLFHLKIFRIIGRDYLYISIESFLYFWTSITFYGMNALYFIKFPLMDVNFVPIIFHQ